MRWMLSMVAGITVFTWGFPAAVLASNRVYQKAASATVWFFDRGSASGVLVDAQRRLVLTAEHVVRNAVRAGRAEVQVIFAQLDDQKNILVEIPFYGFARKKALAIPGKVVYFNRLKDLALVQLEKVPPGVSAVPLARTDPRPGDMIHVIGNSTFHRGGLFSYSAGHVRNSYYLDQFLSGDLFFSLAHHAPTNRGDSGGPVLNDQAEIVGIVSQGTTGSGEGEQVIDQSVHVREIRHALAGSNWPLVKSLTCTMEVNLIMPKNRPELWDRFFIPVRKGQRVQLTLRGNGVSDLDLWGKDFDAPAREQLLFNKVGLTDNEEADFSPHWSGMALFQVRNLPFPNAPVKDLEMPKKNIYNLTITADEPVRGPVTIARALPPGSTDAVKVFFDQSERKTYVRLRGDGDTALDLAVLAPSGQANIQGLGFADRREAVFVVTTPGFYTVRIHNPGTDQFNAYVLTID